MPHPSCKRAGESALLSQKKSGTPPGIRTRKNRFLRPARIPIPPAGRIKTKSPGTLRLTRARRELPAMVVARRSPPLGARACPPRSTRRHPAVACRKSISSCASSSFQRRWPIRVDDPENKKPGALARSGPGSERDALLDSRLRTRAVLADLSAKNCAALAA